MNISVIGLGYVGLVTSACLSHLGHFVSGSDISEEKIKKIKSGQMPFFEPDCEKLIKESIKSEKFIPTTNTHRSLDKSEIVFICVGTPSNPDGTVNLKAMINTLEEIGSHLQSRNHWISICIRSTIPPGFVNDFAIPILEKYSKKVHKKDFGVAFCPEFLREGSAVSDFLNPPLIVNSSTDEKTSSLLNKIWDSIKSDYKYFNVSFEDAEMYKYASNSFHALKISFANEIDEIAKSCGANGNNVMDMLVSDTILNISPKYLKPGFAFGGSCLPKDLKALESYAKQKGLKLPLLSNILPSNDTKIENKAIEIKNLESASIGFAGITFKDGTDDLRESSVIKLIDILREDFQYIYLFDEHINPEKLVGENKNIFENLIKNENIQFISNCQKFIDLSSNIVTHGKQEKVLKHNENKFVVNLGLV